MPSRRSACAHTPRLYAALFATGALLAACDRPLTGPSASVRTLPSSARFAIADGAHGGVKGFYFLPPMVPAPAYSGTFDGTKSPTVRVCQLAGGACGVTVASYSGTRVKVDRTAEAYSVVWKTKDTGLDPSKIYRVETLLGPQVLGFADLAVASNGKQLKLVDGGQFAIALDGGSLPIRFRLESAAPPPPTPPGAWKNNAYLTYAQAEWGDPQANGGTLLVARYDAIYSAPSALLNVGSPFPTGHALIFTSATAVLNFLPQSGPIGPIQGRFIDPLTSNAGVLGGDAVALYLNVQFSDAGQTPAPGGVRFGDLVLCGFPASSTWNGVVVRDFLPTVAAALINGWAPYLTAGEVAGMAAQLNASFANGGPSQFAQDHLVVGSCPGAWKQGEVISYSQWSWGSASDQAATVLHTRFYLVYPLSGAVLVGLPDPGFKIWFTDTDRIVDYLPDCGFPESLTRDHLDPSTTESGCLGGSTLALQLDVDFSDAGQLNGSSGVPFGDLRVCGVNNRAAVEGETVRQLLGRANTMLGAGVPDYGGPYDAGDLYQLLDDVTGGFEGGAPSYFARAHLAKGACP